MTNLPNIEPSAFRKGEYVGYARGVWRIAPAIAIHFEEHSMRITAINRPFVLACDTGRTPGPEHARREADRQHRRFLDQLRASVRQLEGRDERQPIPREEAR